VAAVVKQPMMKKLLQSKHLLMNQKPQEVLMPFVSLLVVASF